MEILQIASSRLRGNSGRACSSEPATASRQLTRARSQWLALVRASVGIGLIDCFAGDVDPTLRRADARPLLMSEMWAVVHADMRRATRVRAVMDFLSAIMAEEADLLEGRRASEVGRD